MPKKAKATPNPPKEEGGRRSRRNYTARLRAAVKEVQTICGRETAFPKVGVVLGSGLGAFADIATAQKGSIVIPYGDIPHVPRPSVPGHIGRMIISGNRRAVVLAGRVHAYEGRPAPTVAFLARLLAKLGVEIFILTNAAGAINPDYQRGDLILINDHINLVETINPLRGIHDPYLGNNFFLDLQRLYDSDLRELAQTVAKGLFGECFKEGIYSIISPGRTYETPAEIRALKVLGADLVGASTIGEAIAVFSMGARVLAFSLVTNPAAGTAPNEILTHEDIAAAATRASEKVLPFLEQLIGRFNQLLEKEV